MVIYGGYADGNRTSEIIRYSFAENKWFIVQTENSSCQPHPRSSHSAVVYKDGMYVFGGRDDDNNKYNDLWRLDLTTYEWKEIKP